MESVILSSQKLKPALFFFVCISPADVYNCTSATELAICLNSEKWIKALIITFKQAFQTWQAGRGPIMFLLSSEGNQCNFPFWSPWNRLNLNLSDWSHPCIYLFGVRSVKIWCTHSWRCFAADLTERSLSAVRCEQWLLMRLDQHSGQRRMWFRKQLFCGVQRNIYSSLNRTQSVTRRVSVR